MRTDFQSVFNVLNIDAWGGLEQVLLPHRCFSSNKLLIAVFQSQIHRKHRWTKLHFGFLIFSLWVPATAGRLWITWLVSGGYSQFGTTCMVTTAIYNSNLYYYILCYISYNKGVQLAASSRFCKQKSYFSIPGTP